MNASVADSLLLSRHEADLAAVERVRLADFRGPAYEPYPVGPDYLSQAQGLPADNERQPEQQDQRGEHVTYLVPAKTLLRG